MIVIQNKTEFSCIFKYIRVRLTTQQYIYKRLLNPKKGLLKNINFKPLMHLVIIQVLVKYAGLLRNHSRASQCLQNYLP